eukprot:2533781-Amphidinium_carterae.1
MKVVASGPVSTASSHTAAPFKSNKSQGTIHPSPCTFTMSPGTMAAASSTSDGDHSAFVCSP